jgi:Outer membrane protein beta-barrel domain
MPGASSRAPKGPVECSKNLHSLAPRGRKIVYFLHRKAHNEPGRMEYMKKSLVAKASAAILFAALLVQPVQSAEISAGARLGLNVAGIIGDTATIMLPRVGFNLEAFSTQWFNQSFGLQEELGFGTRGFSWKDTSVVATNLSHQFPNSFTYLEIPILAKWRFVQRENLRPTLYGGVTVGFPVYAQSVLTGSTQDLIQIIHPADLGLTAGLSLDIKRENLLIPIDIRYTWGATNFLNNADYPVELHHSVFSISAGLGWILSMGKKKEDNGAGGGVGD